MDGAVLYSVRYGWVKKINKPELDIAVYIQAQFCGTVTVHTYTTAGRRGLRLSLSLQSSSSASWDLLPFQSFPTAPFTFSKSPESIETRSHTAFKMQLQNRLLLSSSLLIAPIVAQNFQSSSKRGLVFVSNPAHPNDNYQWAPPNSDLTWYYNYTPQPSPIYSNVSQSDFEFVPMLWSPSETFKTQIETLISNGVNITHVMAYNEPDGDNATGGSAVDPQTAAENYIAQIEPLRDLGIKVGAPGVTGSPRGHQWLEDFFSACTALGTNCTIDFIPIHWYGNFEGLASHLGTVSAKYASMLKSSFKVFTDLVQLPQRLSMDHRICLERCLS